MMKKLIAMAAASILTMGMTSAGAANPFVDVPADSWAYHSVAELAEAGVIQGVDGNYFQGNRSITRYEAAEMVAKAMAHMDRASAEQRAVIHKLADEYAEELNRLGLRVAALENKVGNVKFSGDARFRYRYQNSAGSRAGKENDNSWDYRIRLRGQAQLDERLKATVSISSDWQSFSENGAVSGGTNDAFADALKVDYEADSFYLSLGRTDIYKIGGPRSYGYTYSDIFDRAEGQYRTDAFALTAGYGKFKKGNVMAGSVQGDDSINGVKTGYGEIEAFFGSDSAAGVYYNDFNTTGNGEANRDFNADSLWGAYASVNIGSKWNVLAQYERTNLNHDTQYTHDDGSADLFIGRLMYGKSSMASPKSWDIWTEYIDAEDGTWLGGFTTSWRFASQMDNLTSWGVGVDYVFAKNAMFSVMQSFATEAKAGGMADPEEQTRAELIFAF